MLTFCSQIQKSLSLGNGSLTHFQNLQRESFISVGFASTHWREKTPLPVRTVREASGKFTRKENSRWVHLTKVHWGNFWSHGPKITYKGNSSFSLEFMWNTLPRPWGSLSTQRKLVPVTIFHGGRKFHGWMLNHVETRRGVALEDGRHLHRCCRQKLLPLHGRNCWEESYIKRDEGATEKGIVGMEMLIRSCFCKPNVFFWESLAVYLWVAWNSQRPDWPCAHGDPPAITL